MSSAIDAGMRVRVLATADAAIFQELRLRGLREAPTAFASSYEEECDTPLDVLAKRLEPRDGNAILGAFEGDRLVGVVGIERQRMKKLAHRAGLWGMYVEPGARKRGAGRLLVAKALEYARDTLRVASVGLGVNANNTAAIVLYRSLGFEEFGYERGFLLVDGVLYDEIHMLRVL